MTSKERVKVEKFYILENDMTTGTNCCVAIAEFSSGIEARQFMKYKAKHPKNKQCVYTIKRIKE